MKDSSESPPLVLRNNLLKTTLVLAAALTVGLFVGAARPAAAATAATSATPCWKSLLNEWYSGRIQHIYPLHCYQDALTHLPSDVSTYSSARDDIERALQSARSAAASAGHKITPNTLIRPASIPGFTSIGKGGKTVTVNEPKRQKSKGLAGVAAKFDPGSPSALPIPLLILAGLALVLVAAGAGGMLWKRYQGRGPHPS
ncbi:MAG TPA: hypothetical protein VGH52_06125 [Gaiellaceae bacterium]|jgi:hypothetical protein